MPDRLFLGSVGSACVQSTALSVSRSTPTHSRPPAPAGPLFGDTKGDYGLFKLLTIPIASMMGARPAAPPGGSRLLGQGPDRSPPWKVPCEGFAQTPRTEVGLSRVVGSEIGTPTRLVNYVIKWMNGGTKRQCDRALSWRAWARRAGGSGGPQFFARAMAARTDNELKWAGIPIPSAARLSVS